MSARFGDSAVESALMLKALCDRLARVVKTLKPMVQLDGQWMSFQRY